MMERFGGNMGHPELIIEICIGIGTILSIWKILNKKIDKEREKFDFLRKELNEGFDEVDIRSESSDQKNENYFEKVDENFSYLREEISEIKERLTFIEASIFYRISPSKQEKVASYNRSEAMREWHKAKRQKRLENKEDK